MNFSLSFLAVIDDTIGSFGHKEAWLRWQGGHSANFAQSE